MRPDPASVRISIDVQADPEQVARRGASLLAAACRAGADERGSCAIAVSGGTTPWAMFAALADEDVPWQAVRIWQVDERIAPLDDDARGLAHLNAALPVPGRSRIQPMPVDGIDPADDAALAEAAAAYAADLPERFDLIHLGLGADGHTASLVPGDAALDVQDRDVAITGTYRGRRRMTLTFPVLDRARQILWVATGASKSPALRSLLERDPSVPAARVAAPTQRAIVDSAAWGPGSTTERHPAVGTNR